MEVLAEKDRSRAPYTRPFVFMDLPTELLTLIFQDIFQDMHPRTLLGLARLCRRLNVIALPAWLKQMEIRLHDPEYSLALGRDQPFSVLRGIRLSIAVNPLHQLDCAFHFDHAIKEMCEVRELLILAPAVTRLRLYFKPVPCYMRDMYDTERELVALTEALLSVLNTLHGKSCVCLEIAGLKSPSAISFVRRQLDLLPLETLQKVTISTSNTLWGKVLDWVVQSLSNSPVNALKLVTHNYLDLTALTILSRAVLPHLTDVHLCVTDQIHDLRMLYPTITSLRLPTTEILCLPRKGDACLLPNLTMLACFPRFVIQFLSQHGIAPALNTIHLLTAGCKTSLDEPVYTFSSVELTETFALISTFPNIHRLSFSTNGGSMAAWMKKSTNVEPQVTSKATFVFQYVDHLAVLNGSRIQPVFPQWLGMLFPNLRTLILGDFRTLDDQTLFLRQVRKVCPALREVSFSKDTPLKPVVEWLRGDVVLA